GLVATDRAPLRSVTSVTTFRCGTGELRWFTTESEVGSRLSPRSPQSRSSGRCRLRTIDYSVESRPACERGGCLIFGGALLPAITRRPRLRLTGWTLSVASHRP